MFVHATYNLWRLNQHLHKSCMNCEEDDPSSPKFEKCIIDLSINYKIL